MEYVLGIDQGGSKTAAVAMAADGTIAGTGAGEGAQYLLSGMETAMDAVMAAVRQALAGAGIGPDRVAAVAAGLTGADWPEEYNLLREALAGRMGRGGIRVHNDCMIALRGGTNERYGAVICAGTGLNVGVRCPDGGVFVFGYYIDEQYQGASALGRHTVQAVIEAAAGVGPVTALTEPLLGQFGVPSVEDLLRMFSHGKSAVPLHALSKMLFDVAERGDPVATGIIERFGSGAARYVVSGLRRCGMLDRGVDIVLSGGVLKSRCSVLRKSISSIIAPACPSARIVDAAYEPAVGAALLALEEHRNAPLDGPTLAVLQSSAEQHGLLRVVG